MKRSYFLQVAGLLFSVTAMAHAQVSAFQQADSLAAGRGGRGVGSDYAAAYRALVENSTVMPRGERDKPFSAVVTTQTTQTFLDGTHVSQTTTMLEYRDAEGRVRTETGQPGQARVIAIRDPVAGVSYRLDPSRKSAVKTAIADVAIAPAGGGRGRGNGAPQTQTQENVRIALERLTAIERSRAQAPGSDPNDIAADLGTTMLNGVPARGTRTTTVVPAGAIGNDREFRSVSERWFSPDLNLLVKSVNTDPRFGTTTYELTNISRQPPDPSLFRVPAEYNIAATLIEGIEFRGLSRVSLDTMKSVITSKLGDAYDEEALRRDFNALWKTGRFNDIQMKSEPGPRGGVILVFVVTELP